MTIMLKRGAGNPIRLEHALRILRPSPLSEVTEAVSAFAAARPGAVYVERVSGDRYTWSPATRGGPYPLLRILAAFLECSHYEMTIGCETVEGWCVVSDPGTRPAGPHVVLEAPPRDAVEVAKLVASELGASDA
jgi:hypothetical protein